MDDNRVYARNIQEIQNGNARLRDHLLSSLSNVQKKLDDAHVLADTRGRELQETQAVLTRANGLGGQQNSGAYKSRSSLNFINSFDFGVASNARTDLHTTETVQQNLAAISTILHHSNLLPFVELLEKMNTFNAAVSQSAIFLAEKVIYKVSEVFDEEMESRMEDTKEIMGARFSEILAAQAHNAESSSSKPGGLFLRIIFQMFILNFCVSEISPCSVISMRDSGKFTSRVYWLVRL